MTAAIHTPRQRQGRMHIRGTLRIRHIPMDAVPDAKHEAMLQWRDRVIAHFRPRPA